MADFDGFTGNNNSNGGDTGNTSKVNKLFKNDTGGRRDSRVKMGVSALASRMSGAISGGNSRDTEEIIKVIKERLENLVEDIDCIILSKTGVYSNLSYDYIVLVTTTTSKSGDDYILYSIITIAISGIISESISSTIDMISRRIIPILPGVAVNTALQNTVEEALMSKYPSVPEGNIILAGSSTLFTKDKKEIINKADLGVNLLYFLEKSLSGEETLMTIVGDYNEIFTLTEEERKEGILKPYTQLDINILGDDKETLGGQYIRTDFELDYDIVVNSGTRGGANSGGKRIRLCTVTGYINVFPTESSDNNMIKTLLHPNIVITSLVTNNPHPMTTTLGIFIGSLIATENRWASVLASVVNKGINPGILNALLVDNNGEALPIIDLLDKSLSKEDIAREIINICRGEPSVSIEIESEYGSVFEAFESSVASIETNDTLIRILEILNCNVSKIHRVVASTSTIYSGTLITDNGNLAMSRLDLLTLFNATYKSKKSGEVINDYIDYLLGKLKEEDKLKIIEYLTPNVSITGENSVLRLSSRYVSSLLLGLKNGPFNPLIERDIRISAGSRGYGEVNELIKDIGLGFDVQNAHVGRNNNSNDRSINFRKIRGRFNF